MAHIPKGRLVKGPYKPRYRNCAMYFSTTLLVMLRQQKPIPCLDLDWKYPINIPHHLLPSVPWWRCLRPECLKIQTFTSFFGAENYITNIHQVKHHKDRSHKHIIKIQYIHKHILKFEVWRFAMLFQMHLFRPETDCNQWDAFAVSPASYS